MMDVYLRLHEWIVTRDWDPWRPWVIGALNVALLASQLSIQSEDWTDALLLDPSLPGTKRSTLDPFENEDWIPFLLDFIIGQTTWSRILRWSLLCLSIWNLYRLAISYKEVILFKQPTGPLHASDTSWMIHSPNARLVLVPIDPHIEPESTTPTPITPIHWLKRRKKKSEESEKLNLEPQKAERWALKVWSPTDWQLSLATFLSPVHVLLVWAMTDENYHTLLPLFLLNAYLMAKWNELWTQKMRDTQILHGQLVQEFTEGFVYKLSPFLLKRTVGSQAG